MLDPEEGLNPILAAQLRTRLGPALENLIPTEGPEAPATDSEGTDPVSEEAVEGPPAEN